MIKILVLGDSHVAVFNYCNNKQQNIFFEVVIVGSAIAQGSVNPNSNTNALNIFKEKDIKYSERIITEFPEMFSNVDDNHFDDSDNITIKYNNKDEYITMKSLNEIFAIHKFEKI